VDCPFAILGLTPSLKYTEEDIRKAYVSEEAGKKRVGARDILLDSVGLLSSWMEAEEIEKTSHTHIPNVLMNLFSEIAPLVSKTKSLSHKREGATSYLAQTLIDKKFLELRPKIDDLLQRVDEMEQGNILYFSELESSLDESAINSTLQTLKFLKKWKAELYGSLSLMIAS